MTRPITSRVVPSQSVPISLGPATSASREVPTPISSTANGVTTRPSTMASRCRANPRRAGGSGSSRCGSVSTGGPAGAVGAGGAGAIGGVLGTGAGGGGAANWRAGTGASVVYAGGYGRGAACWPNVSAGAPNGGDVGGCWTGASGVLSAAAGPAAADSTPDEPVQQPPTSPPFGAPAETFGQHAAPRPYPPAETTDAPVPARQLSLIHI